MKSGKMRTRCAKGLLFVAGLVLIYAVTTEIAAMNGHEGLGIGIGLMLFFGAVIGVLCFVRSEMFDQATVRIFGKIRVNTVRVTLAVALLIILAAMIIKYLIGPAFPGIFILIPYLAGTFYSMFATRYFIGVVPEN